MFGFSVYRLMVASVILVSLFLTTPLHSQPYAYVASLGSDSVSVIDTSTRSVVATVPVGDNPYDVAITPDAKFVYVPNAYSASVSVIDTATNTVVATVPVGSFPTAIAISPDGAFAYVTNAQANNVSIIDTSTNTEVLPRIAVGTGPQYLAIKPDGSFVYVANESSNSVSVINAATRTVIGTVPVASGPHGVAVSPDGGFVYVVNRAAHNVSVIDTASNTEVFPRIGVGTFPDALAFTPDGAFAYVTNDASNNVSVISTATKSVVATVPAGFRPHDVAFTADGTLAYVANYSSGSISLIDTSTHVEILPRIAVSSPWTLAIAKPAHDLSSNFVFSRIADTETRVPGASFNFDGFTPPSLEGGKITFSGFDISAAGATFHQGIYEGRSETAVAVDFSGDSGERFGPTGTLHQGWKFTANTDLNVQQLGIFDEDGDGLDGAHLVQLWTGDGSEVLASALIPAGTGSSLISGFRFEAIPEVHLTAGQSYAVTAYYPGNPCPPSCNQDGLFGGASTAVFSSSVSFVTSLGLANSSPDVFPTPSIGGQGFFGPNLVFETETLNIVVDTTSPLPDEGAGQFRSFDGNLTREATQLGFWGNGTTSSGGSRAGIFASHDGVLDYVIGNDSGTPVPFFTQPFRNTYQPSLDEDRLAFQGYGQDYYSYEVCRYFFGFRCETRTVVRSIRGIYSKTGDEVLRIADTNTAVPGGFGSFVNFCRPAADNGSIAFGGYSQRADGDYQTGIYTDQGGPLRLVADRGTPLPEGGVFEWIDYCSVSKEGNQIAFAGDILTSAGTRRSGIYAEEGGVLTSLVDSSMVDPLGRHSFDRFFNPSLDSGNLSFSSYWHDDTALRTRNYGVFLKESGQLFQVISSGDQLDGKTVSHADTLTDTALQGSRVGLRVVFEETTSDGRQFQALYVAALDRDADRLPDESDNCPFVSNPDQRDSDGDGEGDVCEDFDMDLVFDSIDNCPLDPNPDQFNDDGDPQGNACDNCISSHNPGQEDADKDGQGDVCDPDDDNDLVFDETDNCPLIPNDQSDLDLDGLGDACDDDDDGDGILDIVDGQYTVGGFLEEDTIPSENFSDQAQGGSSFGSIQSRGSLELYISDHPDPGQGIQIDAVSGNGTAQIAVCGLKGNQGRLRLNWGDSAVVTCGSVTVQALTDQVELLLGVDDESVVVTVLNGVSATVLETGEDQFKVTNHLLSPDDVLMNLGELVVTVPSAAATGVKELGGGLFEIENSPDSLQPITAEINGQVIEFLPGDVPAVIVAIDIKPGSETNTINLGSNGNTPVAILGSGSFDATQVDPLSVSLANAPTRLKGNGSSQSSIQDVNEDGFPDLVVHIDTSVFELSEGAVSARLEGATFTGVHIRGSDTVSVVP